MPHSKLQQEADITSGQHLIAAMLVLMWLLISLLVTLHVWTNAPGDLLSLSFALGLAAPGFASLVYWLTYSRVRRRSLLFRFWATQLAATLFIGGLSLANAVALHRETNFAAWEKLPNYNDAMRDRARYNFVPGPGGLLAPDLSLEMQGYTRGDTIRFNTNNFGFRNINDTVLPKPNDTHRVLNLGDSFVAGFAMNDNETLGYHLERELQQAATPAPVKNVEVLNAHVQSPTGALFYLQREGERFEPDLIILNICIANDFTNDYWMLGRPPDHPPKPIYHLAENGMVVSLPEEKWRDNVWEMVHFSRSPDMKYPNGAFLDSSQYTDTSGPLPFYRQFGEREKRRQKRFFALARFLAELSERVANSGEYVGQPQFPLPGDPVFDWYSTSVYLDEPHPALAAGEYAMSTAFEGIAAWCKARDIPVMITVLPPRWLVVAQDFEATFGAGVVNPEKYDFERPHQFLRDEAQKHGWVIHDLTDDFKALGDEAWRYFLPISDCHFNALGYELAAHKIAAEISAEVSERIKPAPQQTIPK